MISTKLSRKPAIIIFEIIFVIILFGMPSEVKAGCDLQSTVCSCATTGLCSCPDTVYRCETAVGNCAGTCALPSDSRQLIATYFCDTTTECCCGDTCFTPETKIATSGGEKEIKNLKKGDKIKSFDIKNNKRVIGIVEKIHETTRSAYYKITTKDGREVKVTAEHPLYAIQSQEKPLSFWEYLKTESLVKRAVDSLRGKL